MRIFQFYITHQVCGCLRARSIIHLNLRLKQIKFLIIDTSISVISVLLNKWSVITYNITNKLGHRKPIAKSMSNVILVHSSLRKI